MIKEYDFMFELEHIELGMSCIEACCKSICRELEVKYISSALDEYELEISCTYKSKDIEEFKELVEPYGFKVHYMYTFPSKEYILGYNLLD